MGRIYLASPKYSFAIITAYLIRHAIIIGILIRPQPSQPSAGIASFHRWIRSSGSSFHVPRSPRWIQIYRAFAQADASVYVQRLRRKKLCVNERSTLYVIVVLCCERETRPTLSSLVFKPSTLHPTNFIVRICVTLWHLPSMIRLYYSLTIVDT